MATGFIFPCCLLLCLLLIGVSFANVIPRFPFSSLQPETLSNIPTSNQFYKEEYFTQILDHFAYRPQSYQTFQQRYLVNDTNWGGADKNAPIFVYKGKWGKHRTDSTKHRIYVRRCTPFQALLVFIEHRFYGKSIPFGGDKKGSYSNASTLGYLTSTQALADYATLIIDLKKNLSANDSPVVALGGSYGGMLAAWFRLKYPHVAIGALSSSSPILNFENITSPYSFNDIITQDFQNESENCYKVIKGSGQLIEGTASQSVGLDLLRKSFKICKDHIGSDSQELWLKQAWVYTAMTDYPTPSNSLVPLPAEPVERMCKAIDDDPTTGNDTFAKLYSGTATCFDLDFASDPRGLGGWLWQA